MDTELERFERIIELKADFDKRTGGDWDESDSLLFAGFVCQIIDGTFLDEKENEQTEGNGQGNPSYCEF